MASMAKERINGKFFPTGAMRAAGLAVVNLSGELWIQRDKLNKELTERRAGDLSIIFETRKRRRRLPGHESHRRNVLGAIAELVDDETLPMVQNSLVTTDNLQSTPPLTYTTDSGIVIQYVVAVGIFGGAPDMFTPMPYDREETERVGWMSADELLGRANVRPAARQAVEFLHEKGIIEEKLEQYRNPRCPKRFIVPRGFSVSEYYIKREKGHDMVPGRVYSVS
jgi:hypothetical protein